MLTQPWRIRLFRGLHAQNGAVVFNRFKTQKIASLLAYLAYERRHTHSREVLIEMLWPDSSAEAGRASLSVALSSLRNQLEPPGTPAHSVIRADRFSIGLNSATVTTDVSEFEAAIKAASKTTSPTDRRQFLGQAVELYTGPLLPGFYEDWIIVEQERLSGLFFDAVTALINDLEEAGDLNSALRHARHAVSVDPLREEGHQHLIRLLASSGQPGAALRQYRELERLLDEEMAEEPSAPLRALVRQIEKQSGLAAPSTAFSAPSPSHSASLSPNELRQEPLPATVTFLMSDIEGSTRLWEQAGNDFKRALDTHHRLFRAEFLRWGGQEIKEAGDSFLVAFGSAKKALECAVACQQALAKEAWPESVGSLHIRMALHTGDIEFKDGEYHGLMLHRASRMLTAAHGGQILVSEPTAVLVRRDLEESVRMVDLGIYRLRDVPNPERLFQVEYPNMVQGSFPPLAAEAGYAAYLPLQFTRFFGREKEMSQLTEWLRDEGTRLVTLTGPGGTGKTRLALEVGEHLVSPLAGAVTFVPLADQTDPRLIAGAIVEALRLPRSPYQDPLDQAVETLRKQPSLLVLDNFEQLVEGGSQVVQMLLARVPTLTCLVTSRQLLGLTGEREFAVLPLATPGSGGTPEQLGMYGSVQLFIDRAQAVRPDFQVTNHNAAAVAALCDRLEGIPLAIELAAARAQVMTPAQMLTQLSHRFDFLVSRKRDATERHRTLRAAIDWSYRLLPPELQRFFTRLSVLQGSWTADVAETVCEEPLALDFLAHLRECSLVLTEEEETEIRFRLMESLREYGQERLRESEDAGRMLRQRHARYFLERAREHLPRFRTPHEALALHNLEGHSGNLREAISWAEEAGHPQIHSEAALAIGALLHRRGYHREAVSPIQSGLDILLPHRDTEPGLYAHLLRERAGLHLDHQEWADARSRAQEALQLFTKQGDAEGKARAENLLGQAAMAASDFGEARQCFARALVYFEQVGDRIHMAIVRNNLGLTERRDAEGDKEAALHHLEEALQLRRELGDARGIAETLNNLGVLAYEQNDFDKAHAHYMETLPTQQELRHTFGVACVLANLGEVADAEAEFERACRLYAAAERLFETVDSSSYVAYASGLLAGAAAKTENGAALTDSLRQTVRDLSPEELVAWATAD
jgi:predicted ATPase/DNA-binding SARP family transcriptional activator